MSQEVKNKTFPKNEPEQNEILTQFNQYKLNIITITNDTEIELINALNNDFENLTRIGFWFHLKQNLIKYARICGLLNNKNKKIDINTTMEIITQLSLIPIEYKGDINFLQNKSNMIISQYPKIYKNLCVYFLDNKLKYFEDGTYNYNKFPKDIRTNSVLERYNKIIKTDFSDRTCNWVIFINFINNEILRINNIFGKNENINILYAEKGTKLSKEKFVGNINLNIDNKNKTIADK